MDTRNWTRIGGVAGIIFAILVGLGGILAGSPPALGSAAKDVAHHFAANQERVAYVLGAALPTFFAPWFFGALAVALWNRSQDRIVVVVATIAITTTGALVTAVNVITGGPLVYDGSQIGDAARALNDAHITGQAGIGLIFASAVLAYGVVLSRMAGLWRWLGYLALLNVVVEVIAFVYSWGGSSGPLGLIGLLVFLLWSLLTGATMVARAADATGN